MHGKAITAMITITLILTCFPFVPVTQQAEGLVFSGNTPVDSNATHDAQAYPRIAVDLHGNISVVWAEGITYYDRIFYARSENSGYDFLEKVRVDDAGESSGHRSSPSIAVNETGSVFVVWEDARNDDVPSIFFSKSDDGGRTFSSNIQISPPGTHATEPDITIANNTIYVVWSQNVTIGSSSYTKIFLTRSLDWGITFEMPRRIDDTATTESLLSAPRAASLGSKLIIVWQDTRSDPLYDIYGAISNDSGVTFSANMKISDGPNYVKQTSPDVCFLPNGNPIVVWEDYRTGTSVIRASVSSDGGETFSYSRVVSDGGVSVDPSVASDSGGNISVAYKLQTLTTNEIRYAISRNGGMTFSPSIRVDDATTSSKRQNPDIAIYSGRVPLVVFEDRRETPQSIMFTKMINVPPLCTIDYPTPGSAVEGLIVISGHASDPDGNDTLVSVQVRVRSVGSGEGTEWEDAEGLTEWAFDFNTTRFFNGEYVIEARAFDGDSFSEIDSVNIFIENPVELFPDLIVTASNITFSPEIFEAGDYVNIVVNVTNIGNSDATGVEVEAFRGTSQIDSLKAIELLPINSSSTVSFVWQAIQGTHLIRILIDPDDKIKELNESNNFASVEISVPPSFLFMPDLVTVPGSLNLSSNEIRDGDEVVINATIANLGTEDAINIIVTFAIDGSPMTQQKFISYLPINGSENVSITWIAASGTHVITVSIDTSNLIGELNETNNNASITVTVQSIDEFPSWIVMIPVLLGFACVVSIIYYLRWRRPK
ncbi:MAG: CARDB domain-containing protein [Methanomassiliicoccales archaeon]|nr:CARDB domain-containing protein [Methanomassiliicoccales archaeon]